MASEAQQAISELHARGWTDTAIGRQVGRDSSLIHQVAVGKKPGTTLAAPLQALAASGLPGPKSGKALPNIALPAAGVRTRKGGGAARVRAGSERGQKKLNSGHIQVKMASKAAAVEAAETAAKMPGATVKLVYQVKIVEGRKVRYEWHPLNRHGITPQQLRQAAVGNPRWIAALHDLIGQSQDYDFDDEGELTGRTILYIEGARAA